MRSLSPSEVHKVSVGALGLDPELLDLTSVEAIACALRRAAGFLCPCTERTLIQAVVGPLFGLVDDVDALRSHVKEILEALVTYGDLLEFFDTKQDVSRGRNILLYTAPPSFVRRHSGALIVLGIAPDNVSPLPHDIEQQITYRNHIRILDPSEEVDLGDYLSELGYVDLPIKIWSRAPQKETAEMHISRMNEMLASEPPAGEVPGLILIDPTLSVRYYSRRWIEPTNQTGRFVGRREQAYGAPLWCYIEVMEGSPVRFIDLPLRDSLWRGCDEAWRIQAAIDYMRGKPQLCRVRVEPGRDHIVDFFSPVPMWVHRRWQAVGELVTPFSYQFSAAEIKEELNFVKDHLWLAETK